jgi:hypothetical protein
MKNGAKRKMSMGLVMVIILGFTLGYLFKDLALDMLLGGSLF